MPAQPLDQQTFILTRSSSILVDVFLNRACVVLTAVPRNVKLKDRCVWSKFRLITRSAGSRYDSLGCTQAAKKNFTRATDLEK